MKITSLQECASFQRACADYLREEAGDDPVAAERAEQIADLLDAITEEMPPEALNTLAQALHDSN